MNGLHPAVVGILLIAAIVCVLGVMRYARAEAASREPRDHAVRRDR